MSQPMRQRAALRGFSLVELMVSMVIGLVIIGAAFSTYLGNRGGARQTAALAQVTDDATTAFGILRSQIAMAGYSQPTAVNAAGTLDRRLNGITILGCEGGFAANAIMTMTPQAVTSVSCERDTRNASDVFKPDSILVRYEADMTNTPIVKNEAEVSRPSDCQGTSIEDDSTLNAAIADNRFRVDTSSAELECSGSGLSSQVDSNGQPKNRTTDPLVQNIVDMQLTYGMSSTGTGVVDRYVKANDVGLPGTSGYDTAWQKVVAVRVCLLVRSTD
ncbi:PilW family protein, partial [Aquabacterium sp.]|uniref:PilW family protein n=1 Tax=Aquabacterium sp. TaxID=1872578 RepID=UPI0025C20E47